MKIPEQKLQEWDQLRSYGDNPKILEIADIPAGETRPTIETFQAIVSRALSRKRCRDWVFIALNTFYNNKKKKVSDE